MAKAKTYYECTECHTQSQVQVGRCSHCLSWNTLQPVTVAATPTATALANHPSAKWQLEDAPLKAVAPKPFASSPTRLGKVTTPPKPTFSADSPLPHGLTTLANVPELPNQRYPTGYPELDRVLGGGWLSGALILLAGEPGIGKSTLLLQAALRTAKQGQRCLYLSGEESLQQLQLRAKRLPDAEAPLVVLAETCLQALFPLLEAHQPDLLLVDSVQALYDQDVQAYAGSQAQLRAVATALMAWAKQRNCTTVLVGHVTKDGQIGGPKLLEHMVDTVLMFEGERYQDLRLLRTSKNRFGSTLELGVFEMGSDGLSEVSNPSQLFLGQHGADNPPAPGCITVCTLQGSRPLLVEVQALVGQSTLGTPRRVTNGVEASRVHQILAVLERRLGLNFAQLDVYLNVVGGLDLNEPAADLAVALALVSSLRDVALPSGLVALGEVGLTGELRPVRRWRERVNEAAKLGFTNVLMPKLSDEGEEGKAAQPMTMAGTQVHPVRHLQAALGLAFG